MTFREVYVERLYLGGALVSSAPTKLPVLSFRYALLTFSFRRSYSVFARLVQFYLAWCSFILVGAVLSWLVQFYLGWCT